MYKRSIFWFRQDLRIDDNLGLIKAIQNSESLMPIFIFDENICPNFGGLEDKKFLFLKEALLHLNETLETIGGSLHIFCGKPEVIIPELIQEYNINALYVNTSYSDYGVKRDEVIELACLKKDVEFYSTADYLLCEPNEIEQRKVFTPFYKLWQKRLAEKGVVLQHPTDFNPVSSESNIRDLLASHIKGEQHPYFTIDFGKDRLKNFGFDSYDVFRNDVDKDGTSRLSVYIRFGIFSIRNIYLRVKEQSPTYVSELAWREFWQHITHYFPYVKTIEFQEKRRNIPWKNDKKLFEKWCKGETGYPIVDAAMKQLLETNWMHGRARMVVASFLIKDLLIDWRWGEAFFKKHLLDYDENVNFGNWQWSASVGADPKPLRIFSPLLQSQKFDSDAVFIKKYIPELQDQDLKSIHDPLNNSLLYYSPIVDHREAQREAREVYKMSSNI